MSKSFFSELKRSNVIRFAGLYLVGAWLLIQVASTVLPTFDVPSWALRGLIIVVALGFIPAVIFSWVFARLESVDRLVRQTHAGAI